MAAAGAALACGVRPEEPILQQFFAQSRLRDLTALQDVSTVVFEPRTDGIVRAFRIVRVAAVSPGGAAAVAKRVTVEAEVEAPDGAMRRETIAVTMESRDGVWIVTGFQKSG